LGFTSREFHNTVARFIGAVAPARQTRAWGGVGLDGNHPVVVDEDHVERFGSAVHPEAKQCILEGKPHPPQRREWASQLQPDGLLVLFIGHLQLDAGTAR